MPNGIYACILFYHMHIENLLNGPDYCTFVNRADFYHLVYSDTDSKKHTGCCNNDRLVSVVAKCLKVSIKKMN